MPLLADYAITPDVFDEESYSSPDECAARIETIREAMLTEGLVRDLRDGEWRTRLASASRRWHRRGLELVEKLEKQGRLIPCRSTGSQPPTDDPSWCSEAIATHDERPFTGGVIVTKTVKRAFAREPLVARIDRLASTPWWASRRCSIRMRRAVEAYRGHLESVLRHSNSLMFIDPHLDPDEPRYGDFAILIEGAGRRLPAPRIELHRVCYVGSGRERRFPAREDRSYFERRFRRLEEPLRDARVSVEVFIWDDFHDRYLISDLVGILMANGFDTSRAADATTWARLERGDRDDVQREYDPATQRHKLQHRFRIP